MDIEMGYLFELMVDVMVDWLSLYVELNEDGEGSDVHLLHVTQTILEPVTLAILAFGFSLWWLLMLHDFWL
jgi:hypothetical protein